MSTPGMSVVHVAERHRYELHQDRGDDGTAVIGVADYRLGDDERVDFVHTAVDPAYGGRGLAGELMAGAVSDVRARGRRARASCSYVAWWAGRHPEFSDVWGE